MTSTRSRGTASCSSAPGVPATQCGGHGPPRAAKEPWSAGCQSRVATTRSKHPESISSRTRSPIASPSGTASAPPGVKSFWKSTTISASPTARSLRAVAVLPQALRRAVPDRVRDDVRLRALAVGAGLVPPRTMHSAEERALLQRLARGARRVVEIGVYEGSSAAALCDVLGPGAELHLIDPFGHHPTALPAGWGATERASRRVVARAARRDGGPRVVWHVERSEDTARGWSAPVGLVFVDGDHAEAATRLDWELWHAHV